MWFVRKVRCRNRLVRESLLAPIVLGNPFPRAAGPQDGHPDESWDEVGISSQDAFQTRSLRHGGFRVGGTQKIARSLFGAVAAIIAVVAFGEPIKAINVVGMFVLVFGMFLMGK